MHIYTCMCIKHAIHIMCIQNRGASESDTTERLYRTMKIFEFPFKIRFTSAVFPFLIGIITISKLLIIKYN